MICLRAKLEESVTVCIATLCDQGKAIILASDKMVGIGYVEAELDNSKMQMIHPHWCMMIAGQDIAPLFELADLARAEMPPTIEVPLDVVMEVIQRNYECIRMKRAEAVYLKPIGWTIERFNREGSASLPNFQEIQSQLRDFELSVQLLVAGFDRKLNPPGKLFTIVSDDRGIPRRYDIPGFAAIGSGAIAAEYMMHFKDVSPKLPIRAAVYYTLEAKYFGEYASGVGPRTDMIVLQFDGNFIRLVGIDDDKTIEKKLIPMCERLEPQHPTPEDIDILNELPELKGLPALPRSNKYNKPKAKKKS
jgi:20S proteasome alpha/beta subunit